MKVGGIHHVTAITAEIRQNLRFYTETLGLRLVKKSVNQDDVKAYHLFYADAVGSPGTDMTFFDWPMISANMPGPGSVSSTCFRVSGADALDFWQERLAARGVFTERGEDATGRDSLSFSDPEGQALELVDGSDLPNDATPWDQVVDKEHAIAGLFGVDISSARFEATRGVLTDLLGFETIHRREVEVLQVQGDSSFGQVRLSRANERRLGRPGAGGVHHVAFRVKSDEELLEFQRRIEGAGLGTSGYVDRHWFHSLYFREPGGVLFELATDGPGMQSDEPLSHLGERLAIPPFMEDRRAEIEAGLKPLEVSMV
jgi:glyoxalase family protein